MNHIFIKRVFASALFWIPLLWHTSSLAETYINKEKNYSVNINSPWVTAQIPDPSADIFARCDPKACGPSVLMSFGAIFDASLRGRTINELLKKTNGTSITHELERSPMVARVKLIHEGSIQIGELAGHEVLSEITLTDGRKRMRRTLFATKNGFVYTTNIGSPPNYQNQALDAAKPVLLTFRAP